jgi:hypothetical protein
MKTAPATTWVDNELHDVQLGDARRSARLRQIVHALAAQPEVSVPMACGSWAATKGVYRFWASPRVSATAIRAAHRRRTVERTLLHRTVLVVQDTTTLDFSTHQATHGLGPLSGPDLANLCGLYLHSSLCVSPDGVPLGLIDQHMWARDRARWGQGHRAKERATVDKESQRWLTGAAMAFHTLPTSSRVVMVADREADIFDLFALPRRPGAELLVRAVQNRRVDHATGRVWAAIRSMSVQGRHTVAVRRNKQHPPRQAQVTLRWATLHVRPPKARPLAAQGPALPLQFILVEEDAPPPDAPAICWLLVTTLPIVTLSDTIQYVQWYTYRWLIERYHYVLKSGCKIEQLQLASADRLERAVATYSIVAWRLLWLTYIARCHPKTPAHTLFDPNEWRAVRTLLHQSTRAARSITISTAVHAIARLGGFLARHSDGEPGVKTLWRGLRRLSIETAQQRDPPSSLASSYG